MNKITYLAASLSLLLSGCVSVVNIDPEALEYERLGNVKYESTPNHVVVGTKYDVLIEVHKVESVYDEQAKLDLQVWDVTATNTSHRGLCVSPIWRLMDFEYLSDGPTEQYVPPYTVKKLGQMLQQFWVLDNVPMSLPPSGYLYSLRVRKPNNDETCEFIIPENDIIEK